MKNFIFDGNSSKSMTSFFKRENCHLLLLSTFSEVGVSKKVVQFSIIFPTVYNMTGFGVKYLIVNKCWQGVTGDIWHLSPFKILISTLFWISVQNFMLLSQFARFLSNWPHYIPGHWDSGVTRMYNLIFLIFISTKTLNLTLNVSRQANRR